MQSSPFFTEMPLFFTFYKKVTTFDVFAYWFLFSKTLESLSNETQTEKEYQALRLASLSSLVVKYAAVVVAAEPSFQSSNFCDLQDGEFCLPWFWDSLPRQEHWLATFPLTHEK